MLLGKKLTVVVERTLMTVLTAVVAKTYLLV